MSSNSDLEVRKREISALVDGVISLERALREKGIDAVDPEDRLEAMDIINRIERKLLANIPAKTEAADSEDTWVQLRDIPVRFALPSQAKDAAE
jgi:hypothetical protein